MSRISPDVYHGLRDRLLPGQRLGYAKLGAVVRWSRLFLCNTTRLLAGLPKQLGDLSQIWLVWKKLGL